MRVRRLTPSALAIGLALGVAAPAGAQARDRVRSQQAGAAKQAVAELKDAQGKSVGMATLTEIEGGVRINVQAAGLSPGSHGIHFHEKGKCQGPEFESAGAHFRPGGGKHGLENPEGPHEGDLPNLAVNADGTASAEMQSDRVTLGKGKNSLLKKGGTALVIHANPDDQKTDPSGNSGDRIACGVVKAKKR